MINEVHRHRHRVYTRVLVVMPYKLGPMFPMGESGERAPLCTVFAISVIL